MLEERSVRIARQNAPWLRTTSNRSITPEMPFPEAAEIWLNLLAGDGVARRVRPATMSCYRNYVTALKLYFREMRLGDIGLDHIAQYEELRVKGEEPFVRYRRPQDAKEHKLPDGTVIPPKGKTPCPAAAKKVNQEIWALKRILYFAGLWKMEMAQCHQPLVEEELDLPRALTQDEQAHWLRVARSSARWELVYHYSVLAFATCMSTNELRSLRHCDIHLDATPAYIQIPWSGAKNKYRRRAAQVGAEGDYAFHALRGLVERAYSLGSADPHHYLFPLRPRGSRARLIGDVEDFDPTRPMTVSGMRKAWDEVRTASKLPHFRQYDTRHTAITRLVEAGVPMGVIMEMAGHVSERMMRHYTHISETTKLQAMRQVQARAHDPQPLTSLDHGPTLITAKKRPAFERPNQAARSSMFFINSFTVV